jgi:hypothetical protein
MDSNTPNEDLKDIVGSMDQPGKFLDNDYL